ncbi:FAD dependent oxidoreductase [Colletotrichum truncatum]|uniref:FAD dependent oxidoreductase n=1 Tax=Colletotrichum truncatum TaxID=5467 RepID=A0ACC3YAZ9_COLTU|nr:FAD dependent oxidoreductase [Colletotrichum truncatum]KAF6781465.1 FAD dependent oxidoreductase [Colletotrichum truncatum]
MTVNIVVLGAGVSGLTSTLQLAKDSRNSITVIAKHMPGDYSIDYASPWAGANFQPFSPETDCRWEERSWPEMSRLAANVPEAGIHYQKSHIYRRQKDVESGATSFDSMFIQNPWYRRLFPDFHELEKHELPDGVTSGCEFTGICINTAIYLPWLVGQCRKLGVVFRRGTVNHISDLKNMHHSGKKADIIVNTSGLGALKLGGVEDTDMMPIRGQIVLVENESPSMYNVSGTDDGAEEISYVMTRAAGGGTVLGGTYQKGNWDPNPDPAIAERIIQRAVKLRPDMVGGKGRDAIKVIRSSVGLRPYRKSGVRVEAELTRLSGDDTLLVHNYGHAGWGYQGSYGCAEHVKDLVTKYVQERIAPVEIRSKL